jgi:hypothetical protein
MEKTFTEVKEIFEFADELGIDRRELAQNIIDGAEDFEIDCYRFIEEDEIDKIQVEELQSDPYILGCFNTSFIADNSNLSYDIVEALQKGDQYESLGQHLIDNDCVEDMQEEYSRLDGYGHHFAHYDHHTMEDKVN